MLGTGFLVYVFSARVSSMAVLVDFIGLYQSTFLACFGSYSFWNKSGLGRIILGLVLLFFLVVFSSYYLIITYHIPVSFWVSFMYVSLLTTISCYACLIGQ